MCLQTTVVLNRKERKEKKKGGTQTNDSNHLMHACMHACMHHHRRCSITRPTAASKLKQAQASSNKLRSAASSPPRGVTVLVLRLFCAGGRTIHVLFMPPLYPRRYHVVFNGRAQIHTASQQQTPISFIFAILSPCLLLPLSHPPPTTPPSSISSQPNQTTASTHLHQQV